MSQQPQQQPQSQQPQSQQPSQQMQPGGPGQVGQSTAGGGTQMGQQFAGRLQPQQRSALVDITRAIEVCEWCADQCVQSADPNMIECIRLCEDVSELGESALVLLPRNSRFATSVAEIFQQAAIACAQECSQHPHSHCQECATILGQTVDAVGQFVQQPPR